MGQIVSAYKTKADQSVPDVPKNPESDVRNEPTASASTNSIPDSVKNSNSGDMGNYQAAIDTYGAQNEPPATPVPNQTAPNNRVSKFAQTAMDSGVLDETGQERLKQRISEGDSSFVYVPYKDLKAQKKAQIVMERQGLHGAYEQFKGVVNRVVRGVFAAACGLVRIVASTEVVATISRIKEMALLFL